MSNACKMENSQLADSSTTPPPPHQSVGIVVEIIITLLQNPQEVGKKEASAFKEVPHWIIIV